MTKNILIALAVAALPVLAQDAPCGPKPCPMPGAPKCHRPCGPKADMHKNLLEKFDTNKDGQLDDQEKEAMKAACDARHAEMKQKMLEKLDANKDGQLDEQEKAAMKAEFEARHGDKGPRGCKPCGPKGDMHKAMLEKFDANKDGQLDEQEKAAMKAEFEARHGNKPACGPKGPRHHKGHGPKGDMHKVMLEKFDANKDGQLDDQEKAAMKAEFEAKHAEMKQKALEKFDANKDGQLDDQEKAAMKAEFEAKHGKPCGPKGPRGPKGGKCCH